MQTGALSIDLAAIRRNWRALARLGPGAETGAVVKADAYGLGAAEVGPALAREGARSFFVAHAAEGAALRRALGPGPRILTLTGHLEGDAPLLREAGLVPLLSTPGQVARHFAALPGHPFGLQLDTGMNRMGIGPDDWRAVAMQALPRGPVLITSHLASSDRPGDPMNAAQLALFRELTAGTGVPRSLAATGGILLGADYAFDLTRPGVGLYGGLPFAAAEPVLHLALPVLQVRDLAPGETVGYDATFTVTRPSRIATVAGGYADGLPRALAGRLTLWHGDRPCPAVGRVSMDLITVDVTDLPGVPDALDAIGPHQGIDALAASAGTIGYEILTALGRRYRRSYTGQA
ncbi:MAG: alanine racemase [Rhodobacteraceae bacterium]|nr:alanine racemase [Paracoccaceae bacterium]